MAAEEDSILAEVRIHLVEGIHLADIHLVGGSHLVDSLAGSHHLAEEDSTHGFAGPDRRHQSNYRGDQMGERRKHHLRSKTYWHHQSCLCGLVEGEQEARRIATKYG